MSGRLDSNQRPPEPHLRRQVANPWHSSPYTFNNTQETQDFNGFAKGLLRSVMRPGWSGRHSLPALLSGSRLPRLASQRSLPTPDTPAIASTSNAVARLHRLGIRRRANHGQSSLDVRIRRRDSRRLAAGSSGIEILEFPSMVACPASARLPPRPLLPVPTPADGPEQAPSGSRRRSGRAFLQSIDVERAPTQQAETLLAAGQSGGEEDRASRLPSRTIAAFPGDAGHTIRRGGVRTPLSARSPLPPPRLSPSLHISLLPVPGPPSPVHPLRPHFAPAGPLRRRGHRGKLSGGTGQQP